MESHNRGVGLIKYTRALKILGYQVLRLTVALARVIARGHIAVGAAGVDGFTEPVGSIEGEAVPRGRLEVDARRVEVRVGRVSRLAEFEAARVRAPGSLQVAITRAGCCRLPTMPDDIGSRDRK